MDGMTKELAYQLASAGISNMDDLAEQAVDDLLLLKLSGLNEERAAELIMAARKPWFDDKPGE